MSSDPIQPWEFVSRDDGALASSRHWVFDTARALLTQPLDIAIGDILRSIGTSAGADRAWMFEYEHDYLRFRNTHEWSSESAGSFVQDCRAFPSR